MAIEVITDETFEHVLLNNDKVVVKYFADWCGTCKLFAPKFKRFSNEESNAGILFIDVNAEENEIARRKAGVDNLPFFATFHKGELIEASATSKEEKVLSMIETLKAK